MQSIIEALQGLTIGAPQVVHNLAAFPLLADAPREAGYITLSEAINKGAAQVTEISEGGSVPELLLDNSGAEKVLVLDGEELLGAKQNRIANLTVLAAAESKTVIPVSCVEAGRWSYRSAQFNVSERTHFARGRAAKAAALSMNMKATGTYGADQGMVWDYIAAKQSRMKVRSDTSAMADLYEQHEQRVEDYAAHIKPVTDQVGVVFLIDGEVEGMDLFGATSTCARMLPKLARSFAIDALETSGAEPSGKGTGAPDRAAVERFLDRVAAAHADTYPAVGLGTDVRLSAPLVAGGGLVHQNELIHLAAFAKGAPPLAGAGIEPGEDEASFETRLRSQRYTRMRRRNGDH